MSEYIPFISLNKLPGSSCMRNGTNSLYTYKITLYMHKYFILIDTPKHEFHHCSSNIPSGGFLGFRNLLLAATSLGKYQLISLPDQLHRSTCGSSKNRQQSNLE